MARIGETRTVRDGNALVHLVDGHAVSRTTEQGGVRTTEWLNPDGKVRGTDKRQDIRGANGELLKSISSTTDRNGTRAEVWTWGNRRGNQNEHTIIERYDHDVFVHPPSRS